MLQTFADKEGISGSATRAASKGAPLKGRLETLEKEVASLKSRTATLETDVMGSESSAEGPLPAIDEVAAPAAPEEAVLASVDKKKAQPHHGHKKSRPDTEAYVALAQGAADIEKADSLKDRVAALEAEMAALKSKVSMLENQVAGKDFDGGLSLLEKATGSALRSRIVSLEEEVDMMRSRVSSLEHTVEG